MRDVDDEVCHIRLLGSVWEKHGEQEHMDAALKYEVCRQTETARN